MFDCLICLLTSSQALKFTSRANVKRKTSGAEDADTDDDSEDDDAGAHDAESLAVVEAKDAAVVGFEQPNHEIAGLASLQSLFEGTQNDPPMPVDYLRGVNSKWVDHTFHDGHPVTVLQASVASSRYSFILSCRRIDLRCIGTCCANTFFRRRSAANIRLSRTFKSSAAEALVHGHRHRSIYDIRTDVICCF